MRVNDGLPLSRSPLAANTESSSQAPRTSPSSRRISERLIIFERCDGDILAPQAKSCTNIGAGFHLLEPGALFFERGGPLGR
jgi:hypothetical protein